MPKPTEERLPNRRRKTIKFRNPLKTPKTPKTPKTLKTLKTLKTPKTPKTPKTLNPPCCLTFRKIDVARSAVRDNLYGRTYWHFTLAVRLFCMRRYGHGSSVLCYDRWAQ